jgi:hypothetical protein
MLVTIYIPLCIALEKLDEFNFESFFFNNFKRRDMLSLLLKYKSTYLFRIQHYTAQNIFVQAALGANVYADHKSDTQKL